MSKDIWLEVWKQFDFNVVLSDGTYMGGAYEICPDDSKSADYIYGWYQFLIGQPATQGAVKGITKEYRMLGWIDAKGEEDLENELIMLNYLDRTNSNIQED